MPPPPPPPLAAALSSIGRGYSIAIILGFLFLFSTLLLASYICFRSFAARRRNHTAAAENSVYLPRIIFVAEEDEDDDSQNAIVGLDLAVINSYPKFVFAKRSTSGGAVADDGVCSICLCEYRDSEMLRMLPDCRHCFHVVCVDACLKLNASCPVCRNSPLSTPLQEVVPLSQYSDGRRSSSFRS